LEVWQLFDLIRKRPNKNNSFTQGKAKASFSRGILANMELKSPYDPEIRANYRQRFAAELLHKQI
jgi:hypothetical protein